jgi:hypothetical protein
MMPVRTVSVMTATWPSKMVPLQVLAFIGLLLLAWRVFRSAAGRALPLESIAYKYLVRLLKRRGIHQFVPVDCINECVADSLVEARLYAQILGKDTRRIRSITVEYLKTDAKMLGLWIRTDTSFDSSPDKTHYKWVFERYCVPRIGR